MTRMTTDALEAQPVVQQLLDVLSSPIPPPSLGLEALMVREEEMDGSATLQAASLVVSSQSTISLTASRLASTCQEGRTNTVGPQEHQGQIQVDEEICIPGVCVTLVVTRLDVSLT